jgi:hypothetical protein
VLDNGGGERRSLNYNLCDSLGQLSGTIVSTSAQYIHILGFYECFVQSSGPGPGPPPVMVIPEPGTMILLGLGLGGLLIVFSLDAAGFSRGVCQQLYSVTDDQGQK